jgi:signal transduction histidine kinase
VVPPVGTSPWRAVLRWVVFAGLTYAAGEAGRATYHEPSGINLIAPVYGVSALWLASSNRRTLPWDLIGVAAATGLAVMLTGGDALRVWVAVLLGVATPFAWRQIFVQLAPDVWGTGGDRPIGRLSDLVGFLAACIGAGTLAAALRGTGMFLLPPLDVEELLLTVIRNVSWIMAITGLGLLALPRPDLGIRAWWAEVENRPLRLVETALVVLMIATLAMTSFSPDPPPYAFPLVLGAVWAAFRLPAAAAVMLAVLVGTFAVLATLDGLGPFALASAYQSAAISEAFVVTLVLTSLAISFARDERREATLRAQAAERRSDDRAKLLEAVIAHLDEGVLVLASDGTLGVRNPAAESVIGDQARLVPPDDPAGGGREMLTLAGESLPFAELPFVRAFAGDEVVEERFRLHDPHGPDRVLSVSVTLVEGEEDLDHRIAVCCFRDVTREQDERDQLVAFAGVVAHDLKNPLTVVSGWLETLGDALSVPGDVSAPRLLPMVVRAQGATGHMRDFIDDLLGFTVARDQPLEIEELDLSAVAEDVASLRRDGESRAQIQVQLGMVACGDRVLVRQLLDNLIGNAVKYVAAGVRPDITVTAEELGDDLEVSVSDNGIGIPAEMRGRVFDSFARAHAGAYAGQGLGLAICQRVVNRHGGRIWVADPVGSGTTIRFTLPRVAAPTGAPRTLDESTTT